MSIDDGQLTRSLLRKAESLTERACAGVALRLGPLKDVDLAQGDAEKRIVRKAGLVRPDR